MQHIIDTYLHQHTWQIAIDMDEYPFSPNDTRENFLVGYLQNIPDEISEVSMANYLMLGDGNRSYHSVVERITQMIPAPVNDLVKPIYRPQRVKARLHHNQLLKGTSMDANADELRMLHYWGMRGHQEPGKEAFKTTEMTVMREKWAEQIRNSLLAFGEFDAFSNTTGPWNKPV